MGEPTRVDWDFSVPVSADDPTAVANLPTPAGRALGAELARFADLEESRVLAQFPHSQPRCGDCALRLGSVPNGCPETLMDLVKCLLESVPFYCHHATDGTEPTRLCAGYGLLAGTFAEEAGALAALFGGEQP